MFHIVGAAADMRNCTLSKEMVSMYDGIEGPGSFLAEEMVAEDWPDVSYPLRPHRCYADAVERPKEEEVSDADQRAK